MARPAPLITPAMAQQAVRCLNNVSTSTAALAKSELALGMVIYTVSDRTKLPREDVARVLEELVKLPKRCLVSDDEVEEIEEIEEIEVGEKTPCRKKRRAKRKKK